MKLVTFRITTAVGWVDRLGALIGDNILDLNAAYALYLADQGDTCSQEMANAVLPADMLTFLQRGARAMENARLVVELFKHHEYGDACNPRKGLREATLVFASTDIQLLSPLPTPTSLRDFFVFEQHVKTGFEKRGEPMPQEWYDLPVYYQSNRLTVLGPQATIPWPHYTQKLDYELEIACVIGKGGVNIPVEQAGHHIAGYLIMNDISARDIQKREMACRLGPAKGKGFATVLGPWLVTADEVGDPHNLTMVARINGEEWSRGHSGSATHTFAKMVSHASQCEPLQPGEIIGSGTVGTGCGLELNRWIQPGDTIELEIDKLGILRNTVAGN